MPLSAEYYALFARSGTAFSGGEIVYTEDVGSSSLSSPTTKPLENLGFSGLYTKFPVGYRNLLESFR
jgi:hypothetical protein